MEENPEDEMKNKGKRKVGVQQPAPIFPVSGNSPGRRETGTPLPEHGHRRLSEVSSPGSIVRIPPERTHHVQDKKRGSAIDPERRQKGWRVPVGRTE